MKLNLRAAVASLSPAVKFVSSCHEPSVKIQSLRVVFIRAVDCWNLFLLQTDTMPRVKGGPLNQSDRMRRISRSMVLLSMRFVTSCKVSESQRRVRSPAPDACG